MDPQEANPEVTFDTIYKHVPFSKSAIPSNLSQIKVGKTYMDEKIQKSRVYFTETSHDPDTGKTLRVLKYSDVDWRYSDKEVDHYPLLSHADLNHEITNAEKMMNERARIHDYGVTDYHMASSCTSLMVLGNGLFFTVEDEFEIDTNINRVDIGYSPSKILMCPSECNLFAFVSGANVYMANPKSKIVHQVTKNDPENEINIFSGMPSYIIQEEFDRYTGIWWSPKTYTDFGKKRIQLLYETVDQTEVELINMSSVGYYDEPEKIKYPKPGKKNAISRLSIAIVDLVKAKFENQVITHWDQLKLQGCHELEYLVRAGWTPCGDYVWVQFLNRLQTETSVFLVPSSTFTKEGEESKNSQPIARILHEKVGSDSWINIHDYMTFTGPVVYSGTEAKVNFLYASNIDSQKGNLVGYYYEAKWNINAKDRFSAEEFVESEQKRLFNVSPQEGNLKNNGNFFYNPNDSIVYYNVFVQHAIVLSVMACDLLTGKVYPMTRIQENNYIPERISYELVSWNNDDNVFVIQSSSMVKTPAVEVFRLKDKKSEKIRKIGVITVSKTLEQIDNARRDKERLNYLKFPKFYERDGCHALLFLPTGEQRYVTSSDLKLYPTIHLVYAGPGVKLIYDIFNRAIISKAQLFTHFGFAVFICDTRGCSNMGMDYQKQFKNKFGKLELEDQMDMLKYVAKQSSGIDLNRVGVIGASYGGYYALHAACRYSPSFYKFCVAASPVVDWRYYDTGYTERYIGLPEENKENDPYFLGSVLSYVHGLDRTKTRLMICHGGRDENVHFYHTSRLILDLDRIGIPYEFLFYPTSRHGFKQDNHYLASALYFFIKNLP